MLTPHPTPLAISYRKHQKSLAYFSHLAPLVLLFFTERQSQKGGPWPTLYPPLNELLTQDLSNTGKASKSNLSLICQGMQKTFLNKSNEMKRVD